MRFHLWLFALLLISSPLSQAQHQACKGRQFLPCACLGSGVPCKCKFVAIWLHPDTGKIWGGSAGSDRTEAGVRAHADKRVASWGQWDPYYRKYEIACSQCVNQESLSADLTKRIMSLEFDHWAGMATKAILRQADINETLKTLLGTKVSVGKVFKDYAQNLNERAKDIATLQRELDQQLVQRTSNLDALLDQAAQAHVQLQAKPLLARGFVYDKASGVFGYGSVDENGAKDGAWNGWYLGEGDSSVLESGGFAFSGSFQQGRREGAWKLASRFPAMTLEGQFVGDKAHGAWTIRDASGQSMSGSFENGVWKDDASTEKIFSNVMEPFASMFGEAPSAAEPALPPGHAWLVAPSGALKAKVDSLLSSSTYSGSTEALERQSDSLISGLTKEQQNALWSGVFPLIDDRADLESRLTHYVYSYCAKLTTSYRVMTPKYGLVWARTGYDWTREGRMPFHDADVNYRRMLEEIIPNKPDWYQSANFKLYVGAMCAKSLFLETLYRLVSIDQPSSKTRRIAVLNAAYETASLIPAIVHSERSGDWSPHTVRRDRMEALQKLASELGVKLPTTEKVEKAPEKKEEEKKAPCETCRGLGVCSLCEGRGAGESLKCTTCNYARKISEVCGTCKGIPGNADCTRCHGTGKDDCGKCFTKDKMVRCDSCEGKGYKKSGKQKRDCGICDGRGKVPCPICNRACGECLGKLKVLCNKCQYGWVERDCSKCNLAREIETKCPLCNGNKTCRSCYGKRCL